MNINNIKKNTTFISEVQNSNKIQQQTLAMNSLKGAMHAPEQFLQLLEQTINNQPIETATQKIGIILDIKV